MNDQKEFYYFNQMTIKEALESVFSKSEIKRLKKSGGIKFVEYANKTFVYIGSSKIIVLVNKPNLPKGPFNYSQPAYTAEVFWEYHRSLVPQVMSNKERNITLLKELWESEGEHQVKL